MRGEGWEARAGEGGRGSQSVETSSIVNAFGCESRRKSEGYSLRLFTNFAYFFPPFSLSLLHCVYLIFFVVLFLPPLPFFSVFSSPLLAICHTHAYRVQAFLTSHCILLLEAALSAFGLILFYMSAACCVFVCWYTGCTLSAFFFSMHHFGCRSFSFSLLLTPCHLAGLLSMTSASCLYWDFHCFLHEETIS